MFKFIIYNNCNNIFLKFMNTFFLIIIILTVVGCQALGYNNVHSIENANNKYTVEQSNEILKNSIIKIAYHRPPVWERTWYKVISVDDKSINLQEIQINIISINSGSVSTETIIHRKTSKLLYANIENIYFRDNSNLVLTKHERYEIFYKDNSEAQNGAIAFMTLSRSIK